MGLKRIQTVLWLVVVGLLLVPGQSSAHRGRLDSLGCHASYSRLLAGPTAGYHCHWGTLSGRSFASREDALKALEELRAGVDPAKLEVTWHTVSRVVDVGTVALDNGDEVGLLGVDVLRGVSGESAAESAAEFVRRLTAKKKVRLEYDPAVKERDGVPLAYVYLEAGILLNGEIIRQGYARADTQQAFRFSEDFAGYEKEAREAGRGLWAEEE